MTTETNPLGRMGEAALAYAKRGLLIFPCHSQVNGKCDCGNPQCPSPAKHPWTPNGLKDAAIDPALVRQWWTRWPLANIGVVTGQASGIVVVDVDKKSGGLESWRDLLDIAGAADTLQAITGSGGEHWVFRAPAEKLRSTTAQLAKGVDTRAEGGYIIAPPSLHVSGQRYEWAAKGEPQPVPDWLMNKWPRHQVEGERASRNGNGQHPVEAGAPNWVEAALECGAESGSRNSTAARLAGYLHSKGHPRSIILQMMRGFAAKCQPPMELPELQRVIDSVRRYSVDLQRAGIKEPAPVFQEDGTASIYTWPHYEVRITVDNIHEARPHGLQAEILIEQLVTGEEPVTVHGPVNYSLLSTSGRATLLKYLQGRRDINWASILEELTKLALVRARTGEPVVDLWDYQERQADKWALPPLILEDQPTILFGDGGLGKSLIAMSCMLSLEHQVAILSDVTPNPGHKVLYLDWESTAYEHGERVAKLARGYGLERHAPLYYRFCYGALAEQAQQIKALIDQHGITVIIVDSVGDACGGEPEKAESALRFFDALRSLKVGALCIAHCAKNSSQGKPFGCYSADTDVLTRKGWKAHSAVTLDDEVACFDMEDEAIKWLRPSVIHEYDYSGPMCHFNGGSKASMDFLVTPNHRMVVKPNYPLPVGSSRRLKNPREWSFREAGTLGNNRWAVPYATRGDLEGEGGDPVFARFLGWWLSEGCLDGNAPVLTQVDGPLAQEMREVVTALGYEANVWIGGRATEKPCMQLRLRQATKLGRWLRQEGGEGAVNKRIPAEAHGWAPSVRAALLRGLLEGDGCKTGAARWTYTSISPVLADDVQRLAIGLGYSARIVGRGKWNHRWHRTYSVYIGQRRQLCFRSRNITTVDYQGKVYCLTVPTGAYVTRRNGAMGIAGNSAFWANKARATWEIEAQTEIGSDGVMVGLFNRKNNVGRLASPMAFNIAWGDSEITIARGDVAATPKLAKAGGAFYQVVAVLRAGRRTITEIAEETELPANTVKTTLNRHKEAFMEMEGPGRSKLWGLKA